MATACSSSFPEFLSPLLDFVFGERRRIGRGLLDTLSCILARDHSLHLCVIEVLDLGMILYYMGGSIQASATQ
jgi:hypothetical protein